MIFDGGEYRGANTRLELAPGDCYPEEATRRGVGAPVFQKLKYLVFALKKVQRSKACACEMG